MRANTCTVPLSLTHPMNRLSALMSMLCTGHGVSAITAGHGELVLLLYNLPNLKAMVGVITVFVSRSLRVLNVDRICP